MKRRPFPHGRHTRPAGLKSPASGSPSATTTPILRDLCVRILTPWSLKPNWDGYGAPVIDCNIIESAKRFVRALPESIAYRPRVVPMSSGSLQLEWHEGSKILEAGFETKDHIHFLQWHPETGTETEDIIPVTDVDWAVGLIQWFMKRNHGAMNPPSPHPEVEANEDLYRCLMYQGWYNEAEDRVSSAAFAFPKFSVYVASIAGSPEATLSPASSRDRACRVQLR